MAFKYDATLTSVLLQDNHSKAIAKLFTDHEAHIIALETLISNRVYNLVYGPKPQNEPELASLLKELGLNDEQIKLVKETIEK